ncbi:5'-deoxynucleotidase HDDC2-like [Oppia nitens]|uniref:5'-deoxynucleotidase HDDC2-like n=1 Tax=Oppia nitens TaxID=1686743 RepID=UPI0023DA5E6A|nr:5'-deoxynucleotidase HDDC2-like [Oppia nitens]
MSEPVVQKITTNACNESINLLQFLCEIEKLKHLDRKGFKDRDVNKPETVAGHMYRMAVMAMLYQSDSPDEVIDRNRLLRMTIIHDMAECLVGDITPYDGIPVEEKHRREYEAMDYLVSLLPSKSSKEFKDLFDEYEKQESREAIIVKEFDRFDVMLQGYQYERSEYETKGRIIRFQEFFDNANGKIFTKQLLQMIDELNKTRDEFWSKVNANTNNETNNCI